MQVAIFSLKKNHRWWPFVGLVLWSICGCMFNLDIDNRSGSEKTNSVGLGRVEIKANHEYVHGPVLVTISAENFEISLDDFVVVNGSLSQLAGGPNTYTALLTPNRNGLVKISSSKFQIVEVSGSERFDTSVFDVVYDSEPPVINQVNRLDPINGIGNSLIVLLEVTGTSPGDQVTIYHDLDCTQPVGVGYASGLSARVWLTETSSGVYNYYAKATDLAGNVSACSTNFATYQLDLGPPSVVSLNLSMQDPSSNSGVDSTPTIRITGVSAGETVALFRDNQCLLELARGIVAGTSIDLTSSFLATGTYLFFAQVTDIAGNISQCSSNSVSYTLNSSATPGAPQIIVEGLNQKIVVRESNLVDLTILADGNAYSEMYITNDVGCGSGGTWEPYWPFKSGWPLSITQLNSTATVYVKFRDSGHITESACFSDSIHLGQYKNYSMCSSINSTTDRFGVLYDSGGPSGYYSHLEDCVFTIQTGTPIKISFDGIYTEQVDPITIYDGNELTGTLLGVYWGVNNFIPPPTSGNTGVITIKFKSNATFVNPGFTIRWAPASPSEYSDITINGGAAHSISPNVNLGFKDQGSLTQMYLTETADCLSGGTWESYQVTKPWTFSGNDGVKTIYVKFRDQFNHQTLCESASIILDTQPPSDPIITYLASYGPTSATPGVVVVPSSDLGVGVSHYEVKVLNGADASIVQDWATQANLKSQEKKVIYLENLNLIHGNSYHLQLRAVDKIGRLSSAVSTVTPWVARDQLPIVIGSNTVELGVRAQDPRSPAYYPRKVHGGNTFAHLSSGYHSTCGIDVSTHKAYCWGNNSSGVGSIPGVEDVEYPTLTKGISGGEPLSFSQISSDSFFACGIEESTKYVYCWGTGPLGGGSTVKSYTPSLVLGVNGGSPMRFVQISVGNYFVCGIEMSTNLGYCWGANTSGNIGNGTNTFSGFPSLVLGVGGGPAMTFSKITTNRSDSSETFACGIETSTNKAYCWGANGITGFLGNGGGANTNTPVAVLGVGGGPALQFSEIVSATGSTCGLEVGSRKAFCWGSNGDYTLGNNSAASSATPVEVLGVGGGTPLAFSAISLGSRHACALEHLTNKMYCWGSNGYGQLGNGSLTTSKVPVEVVLPSGAIEFSSLSVGHYHSCAIESSSNLAYCWGYSGSRLGIYSPSGIANWEALSGINNGVPQNFAKVALSENFGCGLEQPTGYAYCWGVNSNGQLGNTSTALAYNPVPVMGVSGGAPIVFSQITVGGSYACGLEQSTGMAYCWGSNGRGQLGNNTKIDSPTPVAVLGVGGVPPLLSFTSITASIDNYHTCGIQSVTQKAFCWGTNFNGQLGDNTTTDRTTPVAVLGIGGGASLNFSSLTMGWLSTCGLESGTGKAHCWGLSGYGMYGNGPSPVYSRTPTPALGVGGGTALSFSQLSAGFVTICGIETSTGHPYCWGGNSTGIVTDNFDQGVYYPTAIPGPKGLPPLNLASISVGSTFACGIENGTKKLYCWGKVPFKNNNASPTTAVTPYSLSGTEGDVNYLKFVDVVVGDSIIGITQ
jgi:alpha-tubulin suppressor-like RCC1 family protein